MDTIDYLETNSDLTDSLLNLRIKSTMRKLGILPHRLTLVEMLEEMDVAWQGCVSRGFTFNRTIKIESNNE